jgi:hypothetical protein
MTIATHRKHGHCADFNPSPEYQSWTNTRQRVTNPNNIRWSRYGGANPPVKMCDRWRNSFEAFLDDMGARPKGTSLGRFGDVGNYSCGQCEQCKQNGWKLNVAWQTQQEQTATQKAKRALAFLAA